MTVSFSLVSFRPPILPLWKCLSSDSSGERVPEGRSPLRVSPISKPEIPRGCRDESMLRCGAFHSDPRIKSEAGSIPLPSRMMEAVASRMGVQRGSPPQVDADGLGVPPKSSFCPPRLGVRGLDTDSTGRFQMRLKGVSGTA